MAALTLSNAHRRPGRGCTRPTTSVLQRHDHPDADPAPPGSTCASQTTGTTSERHDLRRRRYPVEQPGTVTPIAMGATADRYAYISPTQVNLGTGLVTITSSSQTNLKYEVTPA
jgi:hypothetical protein